MLYVSGLATACSCVFDLPVYRDAGGRAPPCSDGSERGPDLGVFSHLAWVKMTHEASMGSGRASFPFLLCFYKAEIEVSITCAAPPSAGRPREAAVVCEYPRENFGWEPAVAYGLPEPHTGHCVFSHTVGPARRLGSQLDPPSREMVRGWIPQATTEE